MKIPPNTKAGRDWWREFYHLLSLLELHIDSAVEWRAAIRYQDSDVGSRIVSETATTVFRQRLVEMIEHIDTAEATEILIALSPKE